MRSSSGRETRPRKHRSARKQAPVEGRNSRDQSGASRVRSAESNEAVRNTKKRKLQPRQIVSRKVFERAEPLMSRRRQPTAAWTGTAAGPFRGMGGGTFPEKSAEQERPYLAAKSGKDRGYKAGRLKSSGAGRETEGSVVPGKARKTTRWREGTLL